MWLPKVKAGFAEGGKQESQEKSVTVINKAVQQGRTGLQLNNDIVANSNRFDSLQESTGVEQRPNLNQQMMNIMVGPSLSGVT